MFTFCSLLILSDWDSVNLALCNVTNGCPSKRAVLSQTHTQTHIHTPLAPARVKVSGPLARRSKGGRAKSIILWDIWSSFSSQVTHVIVLLNATTLSPIHHDYVLCYRTAGGTILWCGGELQSSTHTILAVGHQHLLLFWTAQPGGSGSDIRQPRKVGRMDHDAATLHLKGLAVGVTVLLLYVPPKLPTSPFLQNLRLNLTNQRCTEWLGNRSVRTEPSLWDCVN